MANSEHAQPGSAWIHILDGPTPAEHVDYRKRSVPADYGPFGVFARSDGKAARKTYHVGLTFEEMADGYYTGKGPQMEMQGKEYDVEDLVAIAPAQYLELHDQYDHSQGDPYPWEAMFRAHVLRLVKGWKHEKPLHTFLKAKPFLAADLGFNSIPDQSTLWRAWEYRFTDDVKEAICITAEVAVQHARKHDAPAPDPDFLPEMDINDEEDDAVETLARDKARQVWRQAKPFVTDCFELDRADNASIPESAWWEQHAYMGMRSDMYANAGARSFAEDTTREKTPSGDSHRYQLKDLDVEDVRRMLRETTRAVTARARSKKQLKGELVSIDFTKGYEWTGQVLRNSDGEVKEPWILGYKDKSLYFQWAVIKIVGDDTPFILDAVPVVRGRETADYVDDLLEGALSVVPEIEMVMMDREFDNDEVKKVCEDHGVYYLNPSRVWKNDEHAKHIAKMREEDKDLDVAEQERLDGGESRKVMYLPKREYDEPDEEDDGGEVDENTVRQEMLDEWELDESDMGNNEGEERPFVSLLREIEEDEDFPEREEFEVPIIPFETNHPLVDTDPTDHREMCHQIGRMMTKYKRRWGIENGFKKIKKFLARTTSKDHEYRYFNFAFACVLYNCWRVVDLLVQLSLYERFTHEPEIDANLFLTISKQYFGLDPPD